MRPASDALGDGAEGSINAFIDAMMHEFGGPLGLAKELHLEYETLPRGAAGRTRIIDGMLRLLERYGTSAEGDPARLEALEEELRQLEQAERESL